MNLRNLPFYFAAVFIAIALLVSACSSRQEEDLLNLGAKQSKNILEEINNSNALSHMGIAHNEIVDLLISQHGSTLRSSDMTDTESYEFIKEKVFESIGKYEIPGLSLRSESGDVITQEEFNEIYDDVVLLNYGKKTEDMVFYTSDDAKYLSDKQKEFIDEIEIIMKDTDLSIESVLNRISKVQDGAINNLSEEELAVVLTATSIAANTCSYWHNYFKENILRADFSWKEVGVSDVGGAVAGAVAAGARWVFCGPPGWKLTAALVVGGAAGASAANAVKQLLL